MSNIYMHVPSIYGNITVDGYKQWIGIESLNFKVTNQMPMYVGKVSDRDSHYPSLSEVVINKALDRASNQLFEAACTHKMLGTVDIHICTTANEMRPYIKYTLENVMASDYIHMAVSESVPSELVTLSYTKITLSYIGQDEKGQNMSPFISGYDLETATLI